MKSVGKYLSDLCSSPTEANLSSGFSPPFLWSKTEDTVLLLPSERSMERHPHLLDKMIQLLHRRLCSCSLQLNMPKDLLSLPARQKSHRMSPMSQISVRGPSPPNTMNIREPPTPCLLREYCCCVIHHHLNYVVSE